MAKTIIKFLCLSFLFLSAAQASEQWECRGSLKEDSRTDHFLLKTISATDNNPELLRVIQWQTIEGVAGEIPVSDSLFPILAKSEQGEPLVIKAAVESPERNGQKVIIVNWLRKLGNKYQFSQTTTWAFRYDEPFSTSKVLLVQCRNL